MTSTSKPIQRMIKRAFDFFVAFTLLTVFSPVIVIVACIIRLQLGSPVLFRQRRPGIRGEPFFVWKFRTMSNHRDAAGELLPDERRLTKLGRIIRSLSLDELPQLINVIRGDMSLVGPRPLLMQYLPLYSREESRRHDVPPGITGWAQVNGRNALSWKEKFRLDVWYVEHWSLWLDLKILFLTVKTVISRRGVSKGDHVTTTAYDGSN